jgi:imidazolonepropionase-like amidohydrolase
MYFNRRYNSSDEVLFGSEVGFLTDYDDLSPEFTLLQSAGLNVRQILETLTTAPARRFNLADRVGRVATGFQADLVVLDGELADDARVFSKVHSTLRNGQIIYSASN